MTARRWARVFAGLALVATLAGCTFAGSGAAGHGGSGWSTGSRNAIDAGAAKRLPALWRLAPAAGDDRAAADAAAAASAALFERSKAVVVGPAGDDPDATLAASAAVAYGVPYLVTGGAGLAKELDRLHATTVLTVGRPPTAAELDGRTAVSVARAALEAAVRASGPVPTSSSAPAGSGSTSPGAGPVAEVAALDPAHPVVLAATASAGVSPASPSPSAAPVTPSGSPSRHDPTGARPELAGAPLPRIRPAGRSTGDLVLVQDDPTLVPLAASARAAGAAVVPLPAEDPDPQSSATAIAALSAHGRRGVGAIGAAFATGANDSLDYELRAAETGLQLPGGGQRLFPGHTLVAMYGTPGAPVLGVLGEQGLDASMQRAKQFAAPYGPLLPRRTVMPAFELIASVASGANGSNELSAASLEPWVKAAGEQGMYVVLDLQPGSTDFLTQAKDYEQLLSYPWVGLALDPEWRLAPGERHIVNIGEVSADEVNGVESWLAQLVDAKSLPPKLLVLHQFRTDMVLDRARVHTGDPRVTVLIHADGQGSQPEKQATWRTLRSGAPPVAWGWKNFIDEDHPVLTPQQTIQQVSPTPDLISYQ